MSAEQPKPDRSLGQRLTEEVLTPLKGIFVGKDEIIDLLGVSLVAGENIFLLGPPGTAKSALVHELSRRVHARSFDYLLTRFTEPNEIFGPFDIRKLREGELVTNVEGMLPEAEFVFLDELLNANSAILNSLLLVLNERVFRRGRETRALPTLMVVGASNRLPEDEALNALFDRFLLRVRCDNVPDNHLSEVLHAGWSLDARRAREDARFTAQEALALQRRLRDVEMASVRSPYAELVVRLRRAGIQVSDRRAVKLQRLVAASALLCGRSAANPTDFWVLRYIWDTEEQREVIATIVQAAVDAADDAAQRQSHPRSRAGTPDPETIARDLDSLSARLEAADISQVERGMVRDHLTALAGRIPWIAEEQQRTFLHRLLVPLLEKASVDS
jgi:MoxR-like ATPase